MKTHFLSLPVALIQEQGFHSLEQSYQLLGERIAQAAKQGAKLVVLSELHGSYYFPQSHHPDFFDLAEKIPGPSTEFYGALAKKYQLVIVISLFEKRTAGIYHNTVVVLEQDGSIAGIYRKMHIPEDPGFHEKFYFTPGDLGFKPIETSVGSLGVLICWDQWFPEAARLMALQGAQLLIYPTAIGWVPEEEEAEQARQLDAWITIQRSHAIANGLPVLVCNRVGKEEVTHSSRTENSILFWGNSFIAGPQGEILAQSQSQAQILYADIALQRSEKVRRMWPFLRDRRIDAYQHLTTRFVDQKI